MLAICAFAQISADAAPKTCNDSSDVQAGAQGTGLPACSVAATCPAARARACTVTGTIAVEGTGIVSGRIRMGKAADGCASINSCTFSLKGTLKPGKKTPVACEWADGYAVQIKLTCSANVA